MNIENSLTHRRRRCNPRQNGISFLGSISQLLRIQNIIAWPPSEYWRTSRKSIIQRPRHRICNYWSVGHALLSPQLARARKPGPAGAAITQLRLATTRDLLLEASRPMADLAQRQGWKECFSRRIRPRWRIRCRKRIPRLQGRQERLPRKQVQRIKRRLTQRQERQVDPSRWQPRRRIRRIR